MKIYTRLWLILCAPLTMVGLSLGVAFLPIATTAMALFFGACTATATWIWLWENEDVTRPSRPKNRLILNNGLLVGVATGALIGLSVLIGDEALLLLGFLLAISPPAVRAYGRWLVAAPGPSAAQLDTVIGALAYASPEYLPIPPPTGVEALSDEELCQNWRASYTALQRPLSLGQRSATVTERQTYLDELERRNPRGFAAWLASGARAPGNPLPYVSRRWTEQPTINWDELTSGHDS